MIPVNGTPESACSFPRFAGARARADCYPMITETGMRRIRGCGLSPQAPRPLVPQPMPRRCAPSPAGNRNVVPELSLGQQRRNYVVVAGRAAPPRSAAESRASLESACKFPRSEHDHDRWELARAPAGATATTRVTSKTSGNRGTPRAFRDQARADDHGSAAAPQTLHDHGESNVSVVRPADHAAILPDHGARRDDGGL
jgi:hypothetical protein